MPIRAELKTCDAIRQAYQVLGADPGPAIKLACEPSPTIMQEKQELPTLHARASASVDESAVPVCPSCSVGMRKSNPKEDGEAGYERQGFPGCDGCSAPGIAVPCWHCKDCRTDLCDLCGCQGSALVGKRVEIFATSREELNGKRGLTELYDAKNERYQVSLDNGQTMRFKRVNLRPLPEIPFVHFGVGCDGCGLYPIEGRAYQCMDCPETIGFDLCEDCIGRSGKMGRFNQNHTPEHTMKERPQEKMWLHQFQEARPDLSVAQIIEFAEMEMRLAAGN